MSEYIEFSAKSTVEALSQAEKYFAMPASKLEVDILSTGSGGFLGMFAKKALIRVRPAMNADVKDTVAQILNHGGKDKPKAPVAPPKPQAAVQQAVEPETPVATPKPVAAPELEVASFAADTEALDVEQLLAQAEEVVARLCRPLTAEVELVGSYEDNQLNVIIKCAEPGVLIGRRAQILDALQYLAARIISHRFGRSIALVLDVEGYRARQQQQLEETVLKLADKALAQGRPYTLGPLATPERRLVHKLLKDKAVQSYSKGHGELKRVVIVPPSAKK